MQESQYFVWDVSPTILNLGFFELRWYSLLFALSFVAGYYIMQRYFRKEGRPQEHLDSLALYMMLATVIGARLGHVFFYNFLEGNPITFLEIFEVWKGGLASHGAAIGLLLAMWLFARKYKYSFWWLADRIVVVVALAGLFIRTGNFFNSEIVGKVSDVPWAVIFTRIGDGLPRHPAQLYEAFFYFGVFVLLWLMVEKNRTQKRFEDGFFLGLFMVLVFTFRFFVEFLKEAQVEGEIGDLLNNGQELSIPFIVAGIALLFIKRYGGGAERK